MSESDRKTGRQEDRQFRYLPPLCHLIKPLSDLNSTYPTYLLTYLLIVISLYDCRAINVNKLTSAGCMFKFWVADWFAQLNNKMGGDLAKIKSTRTCNA